MVIEACARDTAGSGGVRDFFLAGATVGLNYPVMVLRDERLSFYVRFQFISWCSAAT